MLFLSVALVVCVLIGTVGNNRNKALALRPSPHVHKWWTEGTFVVKQFAKETDKMPFGRNTHFSQSCEGCGEKRIKIVEGQWTGLDESL